MQEKNKKYIFKDDYSEGAHPNILSELESPQSFVRDWGGELQPALI